MAKHIKAFWPLLTHLKYVFVIETVEEYDLVALRAARIAEDAGCGIVTTPDASGVTRFAKVVFILDHDIAVSQNQFASITHQLTGGILK